MDSLQGPFTILANSPLVLASSKQIGVRPSTTGTTNTTTITTTTTTPAPDTTNSHDGRRPRPLIIKKRKAPGIDGMFTKPVPFKERCWLHPCTKQPPGQRPMLNNAVQRAPSQVEKKKRKIRRSQMLPTYEPRDHAQVVEGLTHEEREAEGQKKWDAAMAARALKDAMKDGKH